MVLRPINRQSRCLEVDYMEAEQLELQCDYEYAIPSLFSDSKFAVIVLFFVWFSIRVIVLHCLGVEWVMTLYNVETSSPNGLSFWVEHKISSGIRARNHRFELRYRQFFGM